MKLNQKMPRQLRRALRREATYLVKFRREIIDSGLKDHLRWRLWINHMELRSISLSSHRLLLKARRGASIATGCWQNHGRRMNAVAPIMPR